MKHGLHRRLSLWLLLGLTLPVSAAFLSSSGEAATVREAPNKYIGASKCKSCHSSEESGDQFGQWSKMEHAKAFDVLATPEALEAGKARGVTEPQKDPACLKCHVTAHGEPEEMIKKGFKFEEGVSCETCHGPGDNHLKGRMAAAMAATGDEAERKYTAPPAGEVISDPGFATCVQCHNEESPTFERFCYFEAREKISHLNPLKPRTEEELAALKMTCGCGKHDDPEHKVCGPDTGCGVPAGSKPGSEEGTDGK